MIDCTHRYGHTLTKIDDRTVALFGGVSQRGVQPTAFHDLFLLTVCDVCVMSLCTWLSNESGFKTARASFLPISLQTLTPPTQIKPPSANRVEPLRVSFASIPVVGGYDTPGYMLPPPSSSPNPYWFARPDATNAASMDPAW